MVLAGVTLLIILAVYRMFRGFLATIAVLIGLVLGTVIGMIFDFTDFCRRRKRALVRCHDAISLRRADLQAAAIVSMIVVMLITAVETTGDVFATGEIVEQADWPQGRRAGDACGRPCDDTRRHPERIPVHRFAENVGLVRLTGVRSRFVVATAGLIMMMLGVIPKIGAVVASIPPPVLGGAGVRRCSARSP